MLWVLIHAELVVATSEVLDEGVSGADHPGGAKLFEAAHRPQPGLESPIICFDRVINRYERSSVAGLAGALRYRWGVGWHTVRPSGTGALGVKQGGQAGVMRWAASPCC